MHAAHLVTMLVCAAVGLIIGTLSHVLVVRTPIHQSITSTKHHCGNCGVQTGGVQRLAATARISSRRMCQTCGSVLWPRLPGLESFCAVVLAIVGLRIGWSWNLPAWIVFYATLVLITVIDIRHYIIPTRLIYPSLLLTIVLLAMGSIIHHNSQHFVDALIGMAATWFFFALTWVIYPAGMGFGDVRLSALIGFASGYVGLGNIVLSILLGLFLGTIFGVVLMAINRKGRKQAIPFGPFLAGGAALSLLFGPYLVGR
jgi:leader peptidase (prepilin peptidase) / N-methyltransferase